MHNTMKSISITIEHSLNQSYHNITILLKHIAAIELYPIDYPNLYQDIIFHTTSGTIKYSSYCQKFKDNNPPSQDFVQQILEHI